MSELVYKALLIGNATYPEDPHNLPELKGPKNDLQRMQDVLTHRQVGLHKPEHVQSLFDATHREISEAIEEFFGNARKDDQFLLYYSGHGRVDNNDNLYLCARDTRTDRLLSTTVSADKISRMFANSAVPRLVVVLDCCHSGSFKGGDIPATFRGTGRFVLTSCRSRELARDAEVVDGCSAFTHFLTKGLLASEVDSDGDGLVSLNELYNCVLPQLRKATRQIPQRWYDKTVGDVVIGRSLAAAAPLSAMPVAELRGERPRLEVSETTIEIHGVKAGEVLPDEIIDVYNMGGGRLQWTAECEADWIEIERIEGGLKMKLAPRPGMNRSNVFVRDRGRGGGRTVRVVVEVEEQAEEPLLGVLETAIDFGTLTCGASVAPRSFRIANLGGGDLRAEASAPCDWLQVRQYGEVVEVTPDAEAPGVHCGEVVIRSAGGEVGVPVSCVVEAGPVLAISHREASFGEMTVGQQKTLKVTITNEGSGELRWDYSAQGTFFEIERVADGLRFICAAKALGDSRCAVHVASNGGDATIDVRARVVPSPAPQPPPVPQQPPVPQLDIAGAWGNTLGGRVEFAGSPPDYTFRDINLMGIQVGQGTARLEGNRVAVQGLNAIMGGYEGYLFIEGRQMSGTLQGVLGASFVTLLRS